MEFNKKSIFELRKLSIEKLSEYYAELRMYEYNNNVPLKGIELRKKIHKLLILIIKIDRLLKHDKLNIINDERIKTDNPKIYACTHIGGDDIQRCFEAISDHAYLFLGDPKEIYRDMAGILLSLNGVICLETANKTDRKIAKERAIELLKNGGDLLIFPEGAWNITPNLPVLKLFMGTVAIAKETNADIIPIAIEQYNHDFYVSIGKNIITKDLNDKSLVQLNDMLRNEMATQKWKIWEHYGTHSRQAVSNITIKDFQEEIVNKYDYDFTIEDVVNSICKDTKVNEYNDVFSFQKKLIK